MNKIAPLIFMTTLEKDIMERETPVIEEIRYPTGCDLLDTVVGGDKDKFGFLGGKIVNIVGDKSAGKSFLCYEIIAASKNKFGNRLKWVYDNCESSSAMGTEKLYGFEVITNEVPKSRTVEEMSCNLRAFLKSLKKDDVGIYVVDSLDGLSSEEIDERAEDRQKAFEKDKEFNRGSFPTGSARFLSQEFFRTLTSEVDEKNCLLIIVSQLRDNVGAGLYAPKNRRAGGRALDFYAHTVVWLTVVTKIEKRERIIGTIVNAETRKSKTPRPYRSCVFPILFTYGIDNLGANLDFLYDLRGERGELLKAAKEIPWEDKVFSRDDLIGFIEESKAQKTIKEMVFKKWEMIEDDISINRPRKY